MSESSDFEALQKLLSLKRHEQPPPAYFDSFSVKVIARIEAAEMSRQVPWWNKWLSDFDAKPILVCAYGLLVCGGLLVGLGLVGIDEGASVALPESPESLLLATPALATSYRPSLQRGFVLAEPTEMSLSSFEGDFRSPVKALRSHFNFEGNNSPGDFRNMGFSLESR